MSDNEKPTTESAGDQPTETKENKSEQTQNSSTPSESKFLKLTNLFSAGKLDAASWIIRIYLIILSVQYTLLGGAVPSMNSYYKKCLLANALVACIRLHQRVGNNLSISKEHMMKVIAEDSAHYLLFSMVFLTQPGKITLALVPISVMALVHSVKYGYNIVNILESSMGTRALNAVAEKQQMLFRLVSLTEIMLLPVLVLMLFFRRSTIFAPFLYYRYIKLRYSSQRNHYCRQVFYELNMTAEQYKYSGKTPQIVKTVLTMMQKLCLKLA